MKTKISILAGAILLISAQGSYADIVKDGEFGSENLSHWTFSPGTKNESKQNDLGFLDKRNGGGGFISQMVSLVAGTYKLKFDGLFTEDGSSLRVSIAGLFDGLSAKIGKNSIKFTVLTPGDYKLLFSGLAADIKGSRVAVDDVSISSVAAVPGPEAGVGFVSLSAAAIAAFAFRRRKNKAA